MATPVSATATRPARSATFPGGFRMSLRVCFVVFNYLLGELGLAALSLSAIFPPLAHLLPQVALAAFFLLELRGRLPVEPLRRFSLAKWGMPILALVWLAFEPPILETATAFLMVLLLSRFAFKTELNDYLYGHLIAIICLLVGAIFIHDLEFGFIFLAFYLVLSFCLIFYNMMVERTGSHSPPGRFRRAGEGEYPGAPLFGLAASLVLSSLVLTAVIFISFPRFGLGILALQSSLAPISGFSDTVRLGDVGKIKMNPEVVMRVEFKKDGQVWKPPENLYWRGVALDNYDGTAWAATALTELNFHNKPGKGLELFESVRPELAVEMDMFLEAFDSEFVFTSGRPLFVDGNFRGLSMDHNFSMKTFESQVGIKRFRMIAELGHRRAVYDRFIPSDDFVDRARKRFLQLPPLSDSLRKLAESLAPASASVPAKAEAILRHLSPDNGFAYSLDRVRDTQLASLDEFLFVRKQGHCEYFASAMVVLLRLAGVPARLVNGFLSSEWNTLGNYMIIRQQHAHSWVEAYSPENGWLIYDPTPSTAGIAQPLINNPLLRSMDYVRLLWQRYIVRYSLQDQISLAKWLGNGFSVDLKRFKTQPWRDALAAILKQLLPWAATGLALLLFLQIRKRVFAGRGRNTLPPAAELYALLLQRLEKQFGIRRQPSWTPRELLQQLHGLAGDRRALAADITSYYEECRYGRRPDDRGHRRELQTALNRW